MNNPLISIIIPTYNYAHLIAETLQSVALQSYRNWECLIIDDGSKDDTELVVGRFLELHPGLDFSYIKLTNSGTSAAKNKGIELAKGELIQFLDADDLLSAEKLRIQAAAFEKKETAIVFSAARFFTIKDGQQVLQQKYPDGFLAVETLSGEQLLSRLITNNIVVISSPLVRTALLRAVGGFDITLRNNEDWILWFQIALLQPFFEFDHKEESYSAIRIHEQSAMNNHKEMFLGEVRVRDEIDSLLKKYNQPLASQQKLLKLNLDLLALHRVRSLEFGKGLSYIMSSFVNNPLANYKLLYKGGLKLMIRIYKSICY